MPAPASTVCGLDHSAGARAAARFAADLAERLSLRTVLVYVVQPPLPQRTASAATESTDWALIDELRAAGTNLLDEVVNELGPSREISTELRFGEASGAIATVAAESRAAFVVVGSRGLGSIESLLLGSVSRRLATHGPCPTVIVPDSGATLDDAPIMCAVDDSDESRAAAATAATLSDRLGVGLLLVHALPDEARSGDGDELLARLVVENGLGTSVQRIVVRGEPAEAIVDASISHGAGMIVIGSRGRGALASAALGSVSSAVAGRARCAVVVVRAMPAPEQPQG